jgi:hypothetical protein
MHKPWHCSTTNDFNLITEAEQLIELRDLLIYSRASDKWEGQEYLWREESFKHGMSHTGVIDIARNLLA